MHAAFLVVRSMAVKRRTQEEGKGRDGGSRKSTMFLSLLEGKTSGWRHPEPRTKFEHTSRVIER
jgi:hypothetical protein